MPKHTLKETCSTKLSQNTSHLDIALSRSPKGARPTALTQRHSHRNTRPEELTARHLLEGARPEGALLKVSTPRCFCTCYMALATQGDIALVLGSGAIPNMLQELLAPMCLIAFLDKVLQFTCISGNLSFRRLIILRLASKRVCAGPHI